MLSIRENFLETIRGGKPDRFVKQFEYMESVRDPISRYCGDSCERGKTRVNGWGATIMWREDMPGPFPMHDDAHIVLHDITKWKETVKKPDLSRFTEEDWRPVRKQASQVDREQRFLTTGDSGILEKVIMMMGMVNGLSSFLEEPEAMYDFVDFIADFEIETAKERLRHFQPDLLFHHDDWGSQTSLFLSPATFREIILPAYKKVYGFWRDNGVEIIVHHSDSYAVELVPCMIELGVDVFQGGVSENNIPALVKQYGGQISFHAGLDNGKFDLPNWSREAMYNELDRVIRACGGKYLIPGLTQGGVGSAYPGVYEACDSIIDELSALYF